MFSFTKEQEIIDISGIKIGGQPGQIPTVLFAGFFFKGEPDYKKAEEDLRKIYDLSDNLGNKTIPDFFIKKQQNIQPIIEFIEQKVPEESPFSVDIIEPGLKIQTLQSLRDAGLLKRTIYNSIHIGTTPEEQQALRQNAPEAIIVVAFNPKDKSPDGKLEVLENSAHLLDKGLVKIVQEIGIKKILLDTAAMAPGDYSGASISAIPVLKEEFGLPTGCAIHNVVEKSKWLESYQSARDTVDAASNINIPLFGGDFAIFGPVKNAGTVFPIIAWEDILVSEYTDKYFGIKPVEYHPRRKLL